MSPSDTSQLDTIFVSVKEAARIMAAPPYAIYELCEAGVIASTYLDGRVLVDTESLHAYARRLTQEC